MTEKMISYCGLLCTECPAFQATKANDPAMAARTAEMWSEMFKSQVKVEDVWCDGCLVEGKKCAHCGECEIRACARGKKKVASCAYCDEYPCETLSPIFGMVPEARRMLDRIREGIQQER